jgi:hypothetical protein
MPMMRKTVIFFLASLTLMSTGCNWFAKKQTPDQSNVPTPVSTGSPLSSAANVTASGTSDFYVDFDKKQPYGQTGCNIESKLGRGNGLHCHIEAPAAAVGFIDSVRYDCNPGTPIPSNSPCRYIHACPDGGICVDDCGHPNCPIHLYEYEPHDMNLVQTRIVDWWAWTNNGDPAILRFTVQMRPN